MALKSLWTIIIKIAGLYIIWQSLLLLPQFFVLATLGIKDHENSQVFVSELLLLTQGCICLLAAWGCIFKTDWVIKKLNLEKDLEDEKFEINVHRSVVLKIIVVVLGGIFVADAIPTLFQNLFTYFQLQDSYDGFKHNRSSPWIVYALLKLVIGYFMMADSRLIVNFIERRRKS